MAIIDYSAGPRMVNEGTHVVYTRAGWALPWTVQPNLKCLECQWVAAPAMNTAVLQWDTGSVILPGDSAPTVFGAWVGRGQFVRVDWQCDDGSLLTWVGFIDASQWPTEAYGSQQLVCYGLEQALAKTPILDAAWRDEDDMNPGDGILRRSPVPLAFNGPGGRRSAETVETIGVTYAFADRLDTAAVPWSTREAVRTLLTYYLPTNNQEVSAVPWSIDQIHQLPDWDTPEVETRNRTVWDVLNDLVSADRQLGFTVGSNGFSVFVRFFTHLSATLTVGMHSIAANPNQHSLVFAPDALTDAKLSDVGGGYDQLIVRGARRKTICTLRHSQNHLADDWSTSQKSDYAVGGSNLLGYSGLNDTVKRKWNAAVRGAPRLSAVFRRFKLHDDWDFTIGGTPIFPDGDYPHRVELLERLPIRKAAEWDGAVDATDFDRYGSGQPLLVTWTDPTGVGTRVDNAALEQVSELLGQDVDFDYTVRPRVEGDVLELVVDGGPQHMIAEGEFAPLGVDTDGQIDYRTMAVTVAIAEDRFVEGVYPASPPAADIVRRLVVDVGEAYQHIRIHPDTVTEIKGQDGTEKKSTGGDLVDDSDKLQTLAEVIAKSLLLTRKTVRWSSVRKISTVAVGDLVTTAAGATVIAPVTAVHMKASLSSSGPAKPSRQSFEVFRGALDPLRALQQLGATSADFVRPPTGAQVRGARIRALKQRRRRRQRRT